MKQSSSAAPELTLTTNILYGVGSVAFGVHLTALGSLLLLFFNQVVGLPAPEVGAAIMIALVFDAICDPLIGEWSDHTRSRWGRRHPFMYASAVPIAVGFYFLWTPPPGWSHQALFLYLLILLITVRLLLSLYEVPSVALAPELTTDYDLRTSLLSWRFLFGMLGGAGMSILAFQVFLRKDATHPLGLMNRAGYAEYGLVAGLVMFVTIMISCLGTHRFISRLKYAPRVYSTWADKWGELKVTLSNRSFLALMVSGVISAIGTGLTTSLDLYINSYFWELTPTEISYFALVALFASLFGVVLAPAVSRRIGKKRSMIALFSVSLVAGTVPIPFRFLGLMPPNHTASLLAILMSFYFVAISLAIMGLIIVSSMMADIVEDIAVESGQRSEGLLFAANGLLNKCITGFGTFFSGALLGYVHFPQGAVPGHVDPLVLRHLVLIYVPVVALCSALSIAALLFYRIDRAVHESNLERLQNAPAPDEHGALGVVPVPEGIV